jgi:hypothetical protein
LVDDFLVADDEVEVVQKVGNYFNFLIYLDELFTLNVKTR